MQLTKMAQRFANTLCGLSIAVVVVVVCTKQLRDT